MDESEENINSESWINVDNNLTPKIKPKKRSLVERELETNLTARVTSPVTIGDGTSTSRYGRARRLKTESELSDSRKIMLEVLKTTEPEKSPSKLQSPVYKMHASNSPIRTVSPKTTPVETLLEHQIETIYQENKSHSRFSKDEITKNSPCKNKKVYIQKDLIQSRQPDDAVVLIKSIFSPVKGSDKIRNTHLNNILERSSDKFSLITKDNTQKSFLGNSSVVKTLDFDNKKKKKENKDIKYVSKSDLFELEAKCMYQVGDLAWSRMGTYPFWPCIVTRDPTTGIYVKKKLFGRIERDIIHVTFFGDNGRRGWIVDSMLRKFMGLAEFEATRDRFTAEDKKKDPKLYAAFFISDKKQALWHISVEEAETLLREPKRLRIELLNDILENSRSYKINPKTQKSSKVTRTDSDVSLSESLYDTLFSEDDGKTDDSERSKNKSRNKSLDVSEVVTACLDNMAAKTGITKIQRQSHMDRWLQKAKSNTPEKTHVKVQVSKIVPDNKVYNNKKKKLNREAKPYNLRKSPNESHNLLAYHNEHDYSKFVSDDDNSSIITNISDGTIENKYDFVPLEESGAGIGVITKTESLADNKEQKNKVQTIKSDEFIVSSNNHARDVVFKNGVTMLTDDKTKNIESDQSDKLNIVPANETDINDYNRDDQLNRECAILKENENPCCDANCIETDSMFNNSNSLQHSELGSVTELPQVHNESPMEIDNINNHDLQNSNSVLDKSNLSINENNVSIVDSEMSIDDKKVDISTKSPNLYSEECNVIPKNNHILLKNDKSNGPDVTNIGFEKETTVNEGDNIFLDLKLLQKNHCDEVNKNTEELLLYQTESAFLHSIKSTYEDKLEDTNNINTNGLLEESKISSGYNLNVLSKENIMNNGNMYVNNRILNAIEMTKSFHLDNKYNNSEDKNVHNQMVIRGELGENHTDIQETKKENENSIDQTINENISVVTNKSILSSLDSQMCQNSYSKQNELADSYKTINAHVKLTDINTIPKDGNLKDTNYKEKNCMNRDEFLCINGFEETTIRKKILADPPETINSILTVSNNEITLNKDSLINREDNICIKSERDTGKSPQFLKINGFQEIETNNLEENTDSIDNTFINFRMTDVLTNKEKRQLQSEYKQNRINELDNPEFLKYLELRQDVVMDEHPELNEDKIITYLYQTWLYEESRKSDIKKVNNLEQSSSVKGLDPTPKKRSRILKGMNTENYENKTTFIRKDKDSESEFVTSESSQSDVKTDLCSKLPPVLVKRKLSLKRNNNKKKPLPIRDLSDTNKDTTLNVSETNEASSKIRCNTEIEITSSSKCDTVIHNVHEKESETICALGDNIEKDKWHPILFNLLSDSTSDAVHNVSETINTTEKDLQVETASLDLEASDVPLTQIKSIENVCYQNKEQIFSNEEIKGDESCNAINSEPNLFKSEEKLTYDKKMMNILHKTPKATKEESDRNHDSLTSTDSETRLTTPKQETKLEPVNKLDVCLKINKEESGGNNSSLNEVEVNLESNVIKPELSPKAKNGESESNNESFNSIDSETRISKPKQETKHQRETVNRLDVSLEINKDETVVNNGSLNSVHLEISLNKPKQSPKAEKEDSESNNESFSSTDSETKLTKSKQKVKDERELMNKLDETNIEEIEGNNSSINVVNLETNLIKPKQKSKYYKKCNNPFDDTEFKKYQELRQDALLEENPQLTQEEITNYLYKTWLYEENCKSDLEKTDVIAQSGLVKGLEQDIVPPRKIKKKVKVPKEITDYFQVSPKEKPKRKTIKPFYNEDYYDLEDEIEPFERNRDSDCSSSLKTDIEQKQGNDKLPEDNQDIYHIGEEEEIDEAEIYFAALIKPKPNIFKGLLREKVCEICEKTGTLVKCKTCHGMFHVDCVQTESKVIEISTPMRGRKKKKKVGRKSKNSEDSEGHSDDRQDISEENNISIEEIEAESITVDAVTLETQLYEKMKELLENAEAVNYDSYSSDNELDWNDTIAGKCEIVDVKLKRKSFDAYVDYSDFKCNNCQKYDIPVCFVCKSDISKKESKIKQRCHVAHCHKYYHLECLDHWPQTQFNSGEPSKYNKKINEHFELLTCPRHVCHTCVSDDPRGCKTRFSGDKLARCVRCPATYHTFTKCVPAGSQILSASHIICPRHYKHRPGKVPCHVNTGWCFICALGGSLICCEYCPTSFHAECLNIDPPEGGYMCEDCETGRLPLYGEMVWVKLGHYRWWPGLILHPSEIPNNILAVKHSPGEFVVRFFGQYDYYWVNRGRVFPFQEGDSGRISSQRSKIDAAFTTAMEHAQRACEVLKSALPNEEESMDIASSLLPPHYVKLKVNKPCGSLCGRKLDDPELSLTQCDCNPDEEDPCGPYSQCLNRMLLTECGPSCRAGDRCNNRAFEKRLYPKLVPYRTPHRGWGLKTLEDVKAGQFVIEYVGELIDEEEFKRRMRRKHEIRDENFYFLTLDKERMIDAGPKGNLARFMNHCCEPNCETQKWTVLGDVRVGLFALYDIPANSEVTFNYNLESAGIEKKRCFCGAKRCSGYIGAKPKQDESQPKKGKMPVKRTYKKRKVEESPSTGKTKTKRLGRPPKPKELSEIEKDLLIIRNATNGLSSDESSRSFSSEGERLPKPLKRKRVSFSAEEIIHYEHTESPSLKKQKYNEKDVGD